jgi:uncharacterized membrane protein YbhN (UPF0104 family)
MTKRGRVAATAVGFCVAAVLLGRLVLHIDAADTWRAIVRAGPLIALAPLPFALGLLLDTWGTLSILRALGARTTLSQVLPVRVASEALHLSVPAGFVASDTATAMLLEARADVPVRDGIVASIARRWLVMRAHAAYMILGALVGFPALMVLSHRLLGASALPWLVLGSTAVPLAASWTIGSVLLAGSTFRRLHAALARLPVRRLSAWLEAQRTEAIATDAQVARLRVARPATAAATLAFFGCWCVEALESALLLHMVGADVAVSAVVAIEAGITLVRSLAVLSPSGLGVVDLGYVAVFPALGADAGSAAAFVLLKRAKELVWVLAGYGILAVLRVRAPNAALGTPGWVGLPGDRLAP